MQKKINTNIHNQVALFTLLLYLVSAVAIGWITLPHCAKAANIIVRDPSIHKKPAIIEPPSESIITDKTVTFTWDNNDSKVTRWQLWLGTSEGGNDIFDSKPLHRSEHSITVTNLPIDGRTIFARLLYRVKRIKPCFADFRYKTRASQPVFDLKTSGTDNEVMARIHGSTGDGRLGVPVAGGHDCDGDGFEDFSFASIQASPLGRSGAGEIALVFGDGTVGGTLDSSGFSPEMLKIAGDQDFEVAGSEIWIDDVTGDGIGDMLMGRQNYSPFDDRAGAGALTILVGGNELRDEAALAKYLDLRTPPDSLTIITFLGANSFDRLGIWMRTGDVSGDGIADIVVGADEVDSPDETNRGLVYVIRGGTHLASSQVIDLANFGDTVLKGNIARIHPPSGSDNFHMGATCQILDLDSNGRAEVLAAAALNRAGASIRLPGAPIESGHGSGGSLHGTVYIAWDDNFPEGQWPTAYEFDIESSPGTNTIIEGASFNSSFGEEIAGGTDFNNDGKPELFIGDLKADGINGIDSGVGHLFYDAESLKGLHFNLITPPETINFSVIEGPMAGAIGCDTVTQGDFNGDGIDDLAVGNPHDEPQGRISAGSIHILYGQPEGWPEVIDLSIAGLPNPDVMQIVQVHGANGTVNDATNNDTGDTICYSATSSDIDGDGKSDLIVNEMEGNGIGLNTIDVGNLIILSGSAMPDSNE